ncbi:MAG: AraC family transcriptional regulator [Bryobacterales bacterium]|nr:AraC family transcriptional regulator [Bryobacterales bacterium]
MPETTLTLTLQQSGSTSWNGRVLPTAIVSGLQSHTRNVELSSNSFVIVLRFTEIGASSFLRGRIDALHDLTAPLDDVLSRVDIDRVQNALADAVNMQERSLALDHFLRRQLRPAHIPNRQVESAAGAIRRSGGRVSIDKLARQLETSHSTLERRFRADVGVTPKTFSRLARLQNVCRLWDAGKRLTEIAYEAGFSDQPHLIHDFKGFTAIAPETFLSQRVPRNLPTFHS